MLFCARREMFGDGTASVRLQTNRITFRVESYLPSFSKQDFEDACFLAWKRWADVVGITVDKPSNSRADVVQIVNCVRLDRAGGVLADQELPVGRSNSLNMRVDTSENWVISDNPTGNQIDLVRVLTHEDGHCLGANHIPFDRTPDLMNATYNQRIYLPQPDDIALVRSLGYGSPGSNNPPPPTDHQYHTKIWVSLPGGKTGWAEGILRIQ